MEPTVFCLVVPLALNICSVPIDYDPFLHNKYLFRHEREITVNTGNTSGQAAEGKIVNTAQTDKQLIINIETKVLPQFNVYLDSLQQQPRMQCTTNEENASGKPTKRIFTCVMLSNTCCPSTMTCICSDDNNPSLLSTSITPTLNPNPSVLSTSITPTLNPNDCVDLCLKCNSSTALHVPGTPYCEEMCHKCKPSPIPNCRALCVKCKPVSNCRELCDQCKPTPVPKPNCDELCQKCRPNCRDLCQRCPPQANCQELCIQCKPIPPPQVNCQELCKKCKPIPPSQPNCEELCQKCEPVIPDTPNCKDLCSRCPPPTKPADTCIKNCTTKCNEEYPTPPPQEQCKELCKKCNPQPTCRELCQQCEEHPPPIPRPTPTDNCISCNVLCRMCRGSRSMIRKKREIDVNSTKCQLLILGKTVLNSNESGKRKKRQDNNNSFKDYEEPLVINIDSHGSVKTGQALFIGIADVIDTSCCKDLCAVCKPTSKPLPGPKPTAIAARPNNCEVLCQRCKEHPTYTTDSPPVIPIKPAVCQELCAKCTGQKMNNILVPGSPECQILCQQRCNHQPLHLNPDSEQCKTLCNQCKKSPHNLIPGSIKCQNLCKKCSLKPSPGGLQPDLPQCVMLCKNCGQHLIPGSEKCQNLCQFCKPVPSPALEPGTETCKQLCTRCKHPLQPGSNRCKELCISCKKGGGLIPGTAKCDDQCKKCTSTKGDLAPGSEICANLCHTCSKSNDQHSGSEKCKHLCEKCRNLPYEPKLKPGSEKCSALCKKCSADGKRPLKIRRQNCTHNGLN